MPSKSARKKNLELLAEKKTKQVIKKNTGIDWIVSRGEFEQTLQKQTQIRQCLEEITKTQV